MKKLCVLLAILLLCLQGVAFAQEEEATFTKRSMMLEGTVEPGNTVAVMAPFGGVLLDTSLAAGDFVQVGDVLHTIETTKIYAPFDGTVGIVGMQAGDDVVEIQERYTVLMYIEPSSPYTIAATTRNAYDAPENYVIHVGETVYLRSTETHKRTGVGFITKVEDSDFTVEVTSGNLNLGDYPYIYRTENFQGKTRIGSGETERSADVGITAEEGTVYQVHVSQGQSVKRGDLLLELVTGAISMQDIPDNDIMAEVAGVVASVDANAGDTVKQNQLLSKIYPLEDFQVAVPISESDLPHVEIGDTVRIEMTNLRDQAPMTGTVAAISGLNTVEESEEEAASANYTVYIDYTGNEDIRQGMNVNVYFNEDLEPAETIPEPEGEDA